ncbi:serine/threonine-protein phosphatase [Streptomyces sp. NBC_00328]|nr:SpoIIE family protein phosphatase [Streptomyces sp. NBC_00328]
MPTAGSPTGVGARRGPRGADSGRTGGRCPLNPVDARADRRSVGEQLVGATCLYAVYDPVSRRRSVAPVGHPPPGVTAPDARGWLRRLPAGPPLSLAGLPFEAREIDKLRPPAASRSPSSLPRAPSAALTSTVELRCWVRADFKATHEVKP